MTQPNALPLWVLELVAAAVEPEETHASGGACLSDALDAVPADVQAYAAGYLRGRRSAATVEPGETS